MPGMARRAVAAAALDRVAVVLQAQDSRRFGEESSVADGSADALDMHQAFLELRRPGRTTVGLRLGRQEVALADERLVGRRPWSQVGNSFDGVRLDAGGERWGATALLSTLAKRGFTGGVLDGNDATLLAL